MSMKKMQSLTKKRVEGGYIGWGHQGEGTSYREPGHLCATEAVSCMKADWESVSKCTNETPLLA